MVVVAGFGSGSSVHPSRVSGSTSGAVVRIARTVTGPRPASSRPRMRDTAWYWWVEETCTWVGVPMAPERTSAARAACAGMSRYCSATWTRPDPPTRAHRSRSPDRSCAGGVSARTGTPSATASVVTGGVPALGRVLDPVPPEPRYVDRSHLGVDVPGCDGVDPDAQRRPLGGERLRQVVYRRLRGVVRRLPLRPVDDLPGHRPDVDDRPAAGPGHHPTEGLAAVPHPGEVHVDDLLPLGVGDLQGGPVDARTGVVHQDVHPTEGGHDVGDRAVDLAPLGDVGPERPRRYPYGGQLVHRRA